MKSAILFFALVVFILFSPEKNYAQRDITMDSLLIMNPEKFDILIEKTYQNYRQNTLQVDSITNAVIKKISSGQYVTDDAILKSVQLLYLHLTTIGRNLTKVINYLDSINNILFKRDALKVKLLSSKLTYLSISEGYNEEQKINIRYSSIDTILVISEKNISAFANIKLYYLLELGLMLEMTGNKKAAEEIYIKVQNYFFWTIEDPELLQKARNYYTEACRRRIMINRGNIKGLNAIAYVPSVAPDLDPLLKAYVEELGVNWKKFMRN